MKIPDHISTHYDFYLHCRRNDTCVARYLPSALIECVDTMRKDEDILASSLASTTSIYEEHRYAAYIHILFLLAAKNTIVFHGSDSHDEVIEGIAKASVKTFGLSLDQYQILRIRPISDIFAVNLEGRSEVILFDVHAYTEAERDAYVQYIDTNRSNISHTFFMGDFSPNVCEDGVLQELKDMLMSRPHKRFWNWETRHRLSFGQETHSHVRPR